MTSRARNLARVGSVASTGLQFRNKIINGHMMIDQRNNGASINSTANSTIYPVDRFVVDNFQSGTVACQQSSTAPAGFSRSLSLTVSSTDTPSAGDYLLLTQHIEGFNIADLGWGTASAQPVTISFWVRSSVTGTYAGSIRGGTSFHSYVFTYAINQANTWEYKTVAIPGTAMVSFNVNNSQGFQIMWDLGSGSNFHGTENTWQAGSRWKTSGSVNLVANSGATFFITGVQLEKGTQATPFEHRPYGTELDLCRRYFERASAFSTGWITSGTVFRTSVNWKTSKRANPSQILLNGGYVQYGPGGQTGVNSLANFNTSADGCLFDASTSGGLTTNASCTAGWDLSVNSEL